MKPYGFEISDGTVTFRRWFSTNGETFGLPDKNSNLHRIIIAQSCLIFSHAVSYARIAAKEHGLLFTTLTEKDYKKLGNPIKNLFKKLFK